MTKNLDTLAEQLAIQAEDFPAFGGLKLLHIKREVALILEMIGRNGIFDEYTRHDISHIDEMLRILDWLVPEKTRREMSPADWLLVVLSIYFHDLGLLVTKDEYDGRSLSSFGRFCEDQLFSGPDGEDYRSNVVEQYPDAEQRERFLYQEFVRYNHPQRVASWIVGSTSAELGVSKKVTAEVSRLLRQLDPKFRQDLAIVCESHHLNDLNDLKKYRLSEPYGNSMSETANLQYAAVLLRTADLLHMTRDRTPSIAFRVINPSDPKSQTEWAKQMAVRSVRPQLGIGSDGLPSKLAERTIVEVHASFTNAEGFFGLTSYLGYCTQQLKKSHEWVESSKKLGQPDFDFPWRGIDDSHVEASGFIPHPFSFELDQAKILDLLTGHTLYNDTGVVLRELVQNALDAVRLQKLTTEGNSGADYTGEIRISWNSTQKLLVVQDNGTGMTQELIEKHFLKVGSSRYQDPEFLRNHPDFSSISRFGIGILSCFMIADEVEVVTCHPDEQQARHISLRSVHGKYLVRMLDKNTDRVAAQLAPHGTRVSLRFRPSSKAVDVTRTIQRWIVIPECSVVVTEDDAEPVHIGFDSPAAALADTLRGLGYNVQQHQAGSLSHDSALYERRAGDQPIRVVQQKLGAVTLAYAVIWTEFFREWLFLDISEQVRRRIGGPGGPGSWYLGTCVEGVRVEFSTPGFRGTTIAALANACGPDAPKTNVARSNLEVTDERTAMLISIYALYANHIRNELQDLHGKRSFSLTWAVQESEFLLKPLLSAMDSEAGPHNPEEMLQALGQIPVFLVEEAGERRALSAAEIRDQESFWISESGLVTSAEQLIREVPGAASLSLLFATLNAPGLQLPKGLLISSFSPHHLLRREVFEGREVTEIIAIPEQRRVDLLWTRNGPSAHWKQAPARLLVNVYQRYSHLFSRSRIPTSNLELIFVGQRPVTSRGLTDEIGVIAFGRTYFLHHTPLAEYLSAWIDRLNGVPSEDEQLSGLAIFEIVSSLYKDSAPHVTDDEVRELLGDIHPSLVERPWVEDYIEALNQTPRRIFDPSVWTRDRVAEDDDLPF